MMVYLTCAIINMLMIRFFLKNIWVLKKPKVQRGNLSFFPLIIGNRFSWRRLQR